MVIEGKEIRDIFLGEDRESVLQGIQKAGYVDEIEFLRDMLGMESFEFSTEVNTIEYLPDKKGCVIKMYSKRGREYVVTHGKIVEKADLGPAMGDKRYHFVQLDVDSNGFSRCHITGNEKVCKPLIERNSGAKKDMYMLLTIPTGNDNWFESLHLTSVSDVAGYLKYLQDNVLTSDFDSSKDEIITSMAVTNQSNVGYLEGAKIKDFSVEDKKSFVTVFKTLMTDTNYKSMLEAIKILRSNNIEFILKEIKKFEKTQSATTSLGDNWSKLTTASRVVDNSLKKK